jgi:hypothetical protein
MQHVESSQHQHNQHQSAAQINRSHSQSHTPVQSASAIHLTKTRSLRDALSSLSLVRRKRSQLSKSSSVRQTYGHTRAEPDSVPCSPTVSIITSSLPTTNRVAFNAAPLYATIPLLNRASKDCEAAHSSIEADFPPSKEDKEGHRKILSEELRKLEKEQAKKKAQGWLKSQQQIREQLHSPSKYSNYSLASVCHDTERRHRAYSDNSTTVATRPRLWPHHLVTSAQVESASEALVGARLEGALTSFLSCSQDDEKEAQSQHSGSPSSQIHSRRPQSTFSLSYYETDAQHDASTSDERDSGERLSVEEAADGAGGHEESATNR